MTSTPSTNPTSGSCAASNPTSAESTMPLKRNSEDIGWLYGELRDSKDADKTKCKLCGKLMTGGVYRLKQHIAGNSPNVRGCPNATLDDKKKCIEALSAPKQKKRQKSTHQSEVRQEVQVIDEEAASFQGARKGPHHLGPMDKFVSNIDPELAIEKRKSMRQQNIHDAISKERTHSVHQYLARWIYEAGIPFHAIDCDSFLRFVEAVGQFGPGYKPPSQYLLREPLLMEEVERTKKSLKNQEEEWARYGCSIMTDAWSDRKRRSIMNLCVNCKEGTTFLSSKECSEDAHTGKYIFEYVDKCIEDVGEEKVVQVVTDNASNNMAAADLLKLKRPSIYWTSCAAHTINLMLKDIGNEPKFKVVIDKAKAFTVFIYAHHKTLALMRKNTGKGDLVRPGVTRFATSFLTLQSLNDKRNELRTMVASDAWRDLKQSKTLKGQAAFSSMLSNSFWSGVSLCLSVFGPLFKVLRMVDGDKPSMGWLHGELEQAKEGIKKAFNGVEVTYRPILDIIEKKASGRLDSQLHLTAYLLNPFYFYQDESICLNQHVMTGFLDCVERFFPDDVEMQSHITSEEFKMYKKKEGNFGRPNALITCSKFNFDPVDWWTTYGNHVPKLQRMAIRILSLTTSSSGCERNWSAFEGVHTKKRNRLDATRVSNLVYVQFNAKISNKRKSMKDPLVAKDPNEAQGWLVEGGDDDVDSDITWDEEGIQELRRSSRNVGVRELDDEGFTSDDETDNVVDYDFDFEGDNVDENYGV